jgi:histidine triad (HIT) family protein
MSEYDRNNIFARILRGEIPCKKVHEDEYSLSFHDIHPAAPVHVLVIPKGEFTCFHDFIELAESKRIQGFNQSVKHNIKLLGLIDGGYRLISNFGYNGSQTVPHYHVHILGGKQLGGLLPFDNLTR